MRTILVDVDTQHDFCHPSGALFVRGAEKLASTFEALVGRAVERGVKIVGSVDSHAFDAWEFAGAIDKGPNGETPGFPPHCVKGTSGWLKVPGTIAPRTRFVPNVKTDVAPFVERNDPQMILLEKEVYSLFANPNAPEVLKAIMGDEKTRFVVFGVATDYCVRAAALGLVDWGEVWLVRDAIAAVSPEGGELALAECAAKGVRSVTSAEALSIL
ncbi:MAG: cysteine hydrolase family protein [Polyangiales bacterium]